ncbi:MAG TPA: hypothetical protein PLI45_00430 [Candidatus Woesebacteria bacterium]|nr:hypothetical protein [Candidatus Woesebacteria bacterium]
MRVKGIYIAVILGVLTVSLGAVFEVSKSRNEERVLAATTTKTLEERVASLESRVYLLEKSAGLIATKTKASETFVSLVGGDINSADWSKIPGTDFTLDTALYGKTVEVSWQGWFKGVGSVRLYDSTNHRAVDFSEFLSTTDGSKSFYSKVMSIWRGQNQYYIEGKTTDGTVTLSSPRLKIVAK